MSKRARLSASDWADIQNLYACYNLAAEEISGALGHPRPGPTVEAVVPDGDPRIAAVAVQPPRTSRWG